MLPSSPLSICLLAWINVCHGTEGRHHLSHQPPPPPPPPTATAQAVVSPSSELEPPAHVFTTRSNLGDIARLRHGGRFHVCLLFPAIRELVSDPSSKFVFPDFPAEKKGSSQTLNGGKDLAAGNDDKKILLFFPL